MTEKNTITPFLSLPFKLERDAPPFEGNDIKYPESLVRHFLKEFTKKGDAVFDPFVGLGTTLFVAEEMGRIPYGVEADWQKYEWVAGQLHHWMNIKEGDSFDAPKLGFPKLDFCMTSPPFMPNHHKWNPLFAGNPDKAGYDVYLKRLGSIFARLKPMMKKNATIVVQVDNVAGRTYTPLVRDFSTVISKTFRAENEIIVKWENARAGYDHTHCLVFKNA